MNNHTHNLGNHAHNLGNHTHTYKRPTASGGTAITASQMPGHTHDPSTLFLKAGYGGSDNSSAKYYLDGLQASNAEVGGSSRMKYPYHPSAQGIWDLETVGVGWDGDLGSTGGNQAHTHTVTAPSSNNDTSSANNNNTGTNNGNTGVNNGATATSLQNASSGHTHSVAGTGVTISNIQPYITCYMFKRTA